MHFTQRASFVFVCEDDERPIVADKIFTRPFIHTMQTNCI